MRKFTKRGFTLVELMIVVAIIGVLAALAIFGVRKYLANAKTSEAKNTIGAINRAAVAAYNRESNDSQILTAGNSSTQAIHSLCGKSAAVPDALAKVSNKKYQPSTALNADFNTGDATTGWKCLKFSMTEPIYFRYAYSTTSRQIATTANISGTVGWYAEAVGDLNGDGTNQSEFVTGGAIVNGEPVKATEVAESNPEE